MDNPNRVAEDIIKHRSQYIQDRADVIWYLDEEIEFGAQVSEQGYREIVELVVNRLGVGR